MKSHPLTRIAALIGKDVNRLDNDPRVQLKIHTVGFWYWTINFPIITYLFLFDQKWWLRWGLFVTLIYSIYANWTSDYTGMSSAQSVINTGDKPTDVATVPFPGSGIVVDEKPKEQTK